MAKDSIKIVVTPIVKCEKCSSVAPLIIAKSNLQDNFYGLPSAFCHACGRRQLIASHWERITKEIPRAELELYTQNNGLNPALFQG